MVQIDLLLYSLNDRLLPEDTPQEYYLCGDADGSPSVTISATNHPTHLRRVHRLFSTSVALPNKIRNSETITADK
ncbi:MAG: PilW family protein [Zoogloeaceae bacterium]|jgi:hypothetical protein|nr:PilW family protein [Zoogloeaceae bacterium]